MAKTDDAAHEASPSAKANGTAELPSVDVWLVDGFNVLHAVVLGGRDRNRFWDEESRQRLIARLTARRASPVPVVLVFDGRRPVEGDEAHPAPGLEIVFAPSADDWIVKRARRAADPGEAHGSECVGVVSNDRKVVGRCRHAGARTVSPTAFLSGFAPLPAEPPDHAGNESPRGGDGAGGGGGESGGGESGEAP